MKKSETVTLYHGSRSGICGTIAPISRVRCDFGKGFYMGTDRSQPLTLICNYPDAKIYTLNVELAGLQILDLEAGLDWALLVAYNRVPEVILLLTGWVVRRERRQKNNPAACPRMPQVQREAFRWKRLGIDTLERAEDYLRRQEAVDEREWAILSAVGVAERRPAVEKEREFIAAWVDMGVGDELIRLAYERTVYQKQGMNWPYLNKILQSWHRAGYRTAAEVKAGDKPARRQAKPAQAQPRDFQPSQERIQKNADWLDQFLEEQKKGGG